MVTPYKSECFEAIHEIALDMFKAGVISKDTMQEFDESCLTKEIDNEEKA